jgi:tetratricopeptide (TPR) repeat protein
LSSHPNSGPIHTSIGNTLYWLGDHRQAIEFFKKALDIEPELPAALSNYAFALVSTNQEGLRNIDLGVQLASKAADLSNRQNLEILTVLASAQAKAKNFIEAAAAARDAAKIADRQGNASYAIQLRESAANYALGKDVP